MKRAVLLAALVLLAGCDSGKPAGFIALDADRASEQAKSKPADEAVPASLRMIVRTASLTLVVDDAAEFLRAAVAVVERRGGYVAETRQWRQNGQIRATATLRVPADKLADALLEVRKGARRVDGENISGQDVSEEFSDLGAQLTNLQATEVELRQLLGTVRERTQKASDVLEVYERLTKVRGDIDRIQGKMGYLKQMTAMSTIKLELIPDVLSNPIIEPGWRPVAIAKTAMRALVAALKGLGSLLIWLIVFVAPLVLAVAALALLAKSGWTLAQRWRGGPRNRPPQSPPS
jgi:uncharacterized protein DUF4349